MKICFDLTISDNYTGIGQVANKYLSELLKLNSVTLIKYGKRTNEDYQFKFGSYYNILDHLRFYFFLLRTKPNVIFIPHYFIPFFIPSNIKIYTIVHDLMAINKSNYFFSRFSFIKARILFNLLKYNLCSRKSIFIITPSYSVAGDVKKLFNKEAYVIPNGIFESSKIGNRTKEDYFLYVGNNRKHKNLDSLINYFNQNRDYNLKIISDISTKKKLNNIEIKGRLDSRNEIVEFIMKSRGIIMPSLCEGFGLPIIESLYFSGKAYASDIDVFKEFYGLNVEYFDPKENCNLDFVLSNNNRVLPKSNLSISNLFVWSELGYFIKKEFS